MLTLNKKQLKSVLAFAGKKDIRYFLNGIYFDGHDLVAVDGASMVVLTDNQIESPKDQFNLKYFITRENVEHALSKMNAKDKCVLCVMDGVASIKIGDSIICDQNGANKSIFKFPDFNRVICNSGGAPEGFNWYNPDYLKALENVVKAFTGRSYFKPEGFMHTQCAKGCLGVRLVVHDDIGEELTMNISIMPVRM